METRSKTNNIEFLAFSQDKDLCVLSALDEYLNRTEKWRRVNNETQLLLSYIQSHRKVVLSIISGWLKKVLKSSGIDVLLFTAHSTRSATTSKASASALSMIEILERGTWSNNSTWQRFYKKDIIPIHVKIFQNSFMGGTKWQSEQRKGLGSSKIESGFQNCSIRSNLDFMNKIFELLKSAKRLQSNSDFMNKFKERSNTAYNI